MLATYQNYNTSWGRTMKNVGNYIYRGVNVGCFVTVLLRAKLLVSCPEHGPPQVMFICSFVLSLPLASKSVQLSLNNWEKKYIYLVLWLISICNVSSQHMGPISVCENWKLKLTNYKRTIYIRQLQKMISSDLYA